MHRCRTNCLLARESFLWLWLAASMSSCGYTEPQTQLRVWIRADDELSSALKQVRVAVLPDTENETEFDVESEDAKAGEHTLPFSFTIVPGERDAVDLLVRGFVSREKAAAPVIVREVSAAFLPRQTLELNVSLMLSQGEPSALARVGLIACDLGAGACNPVAQCGCDRLSHCQVDDDLASCHPVGERAHNEPCETNDQCGAGLTCAWGVCRNPCQHDDDCSANVEARAKCLRRTSAEFGFCAEPCNKPCDGGLSCSPIKLEDTQGNFCLLLEDPCSTTGDEQCDEGGEGTGFCATGTDGSDCCFQPRRSGRCDLVTQCGCPKSSACQASGIRIDGRVDTSCQEPGPLREAESCSNSAECGRGLACVGSACRRLCSDSDSVIGGCPNGECRPLVLDSGSVATDVGSCDSQPK